MKAKLLTGALLACALWTQAQGTLEFRATLTGADEVPPNSDPTVGTAALWLAGDSLSFYVYVPALTFITTGGSINGPALAGSNAPLLFDLGLPHYHSGSSQGDPPFYSFGLPVYTLNADQINELQNGLWYVNITSYDRPDGQLRGQVLPVPEPSSWALLGTGGLLFWWYGRRNERANNAR